MSVAESFNFLRSTRMSDLLPRSKASDNFIDDSLKTFKDLLKSKTSSKMGPEEQLTPIRDTIGDLFEVFEEDTDENPDPRDLADLRWIIHESVNDGFVMTHNELSTRKREEKSLLDWIDLKRE